MAAPAFAEQVATDPPISAAPVAQVQPTTAQTAVVLEPVAQTNILRAGAEVPLILREELTTKKKKLRVGQRFQMEVSANIMAGNVVVIPVGTPAIGEITDVRNKGMWGKSGYVGARAISLRLGDRYVRLTGTFDDKGVTGTAGVVTSIALVPLAGFFTTGTSAKIPSGAAVKAFLDEDIVFRTVAAPAQVLEIPVTTPPPSAPATAQAAAPQPTTH